LKRHGWALGLVPGSTDWQMNLMTLVVGVAGALAATPRRVHSARS
jgi:hypothetical protein